MGAEGEREAIGTLFRTAWASRTPVAWPNQKFEPPQTGMWVRLAIAQGKGEQIEIGCDNPQHRFPGLVYVQCFGELLKGDGDLRALADAAAAIFRRKRVAVGSTGSILFRTPSVRDMGSDGKFYQMNMSVPYQYDTTF